MSAADTHAHHKSHIKEYLIIFVILGVLTAIELFIPGMQVSTAIKAAGLIFFACAKAFVVAYYYMHLNGETGWLKFIALIPLSAAGYTVVLILESIYR